MQMRRWLLALMAVLSALGLGAFGATPAAATSQVLGHDLCHAVTPLADAQRIPAFRCGGKPEAYQQASLWLRADLTAPGIDRHDLTLMMHNSRFDRLHVGFLYTDGQIHWQQIATGQFGAHWRAGGQIVFSAPHRDAPLQAMLLRFDRLTHYEFLRLRLLGGDDASQQATVLATAVGGALLLLLIGAVYNASLAVAVRRQFPAWQAAWAACMVVWGLFWSQLVLLIAPEVAGAPSAQICTALACLAITLATQSALTALSRDHLPAWPRRITMALGLGVGLIGVPLSLMRSAAIAQWAVVLDVLTLSTLLAVAVCLTLAWRRGSGEARAFAGAWVVPMVALASTQFLDMDTMLWGGGAQLLVLLAAAWQTLWLSVAATHRFTRIRLERDRARQAAASAQDLARRDPLTALRNRRGFIEKAEAMLDTARRDGSPLALLLLDVDKFKGINDMHGHDVGDQVLCTLARRLARWEGAVCTVARFGGEEFAAIVSGLTGNPLLHFAENMREGIAQCDHGAALGRVTVSIGLAEAERPEDFQTLYRRADEALYQAKRQGRNRVAVAQIEPPTMEAHLILPEGLTAV